ncbi:hypothetical protein J2S08_000755 [Bacillus chungangensis]|uniref:Uncharacterized protein n=1 Tax=Bacillus chungangensis TaxID=587633 RepID=A0ABT9WNR8_9BACI|nr:hypothetical protein [Bacillus chungangensis]
MSVSLQKSYINLKKIVILFKITHRDLIAKFYII